MPFVTGSGSHYSASHNGQRIELYPVSSKCTRVELPQGTTHVSIWAEVGAADYSIHLHLDPPGAAGTVDESTQGAALASGQWHTIPILRQGQGAPRIGLSVTAAHLAACGATPVVVVQPLVDPVVAALRGRQ